MWAEGDDWVGERNGPIEDRQVEQVEQTVSTGTGERVFLSTPGMMNEGIVRHETDVSWTVWTLLNELINELTHKKVEFQDTVTLTKISLV